MRGAWAAALALAACGGTKAAPRAQDAAPVARAPAAAIDAGAPAAAVVLPPAPPLPAVPLGLPPVEGDVAVTPARVALGALLFEERRISAGGQAACVDCHDPARGWGDGEAHHVGPDGQPNIRRAPALVNLAWEPAWGWDGRWTTAADAVRAHWKGQLGVAPEDGVRALAADPTFRAHVARVGGADVDAAVGALAAFVRTRYEGDAPWDRFERGDRAAAPADAEAGYRLFTGKAQCAVCHVPPLYTDHAFHDLGLRATPDDGRGRVDAAAAGAFRTPTLRGATLHPPYFHDGSAATLEASIEWHLAGGLGEGAGAGGVDPALVPVTLTDAERAQLVAFVRALTR